MNVIDFISQPWHWSVSGVMIVLVMFLLIYVGKRFGVSSSFQAICAIGGAGKKIDYFNYDWKSHDWLLTFVIGSIIGGAIAVHLLTSPEPVQVSAATIADLEALGIQAPRTKEDGMGFIPHDLFNFENLTSLKGFFFMVVGGFLIGFGARYGGGCTSGHAITGLSNFQLPSLIAVIGFFIGGLFSTFVLFPFILSYLGVTP
ncbi:MAG TPA: YeeE/YedE family protein [Phaeodactylibacter sp.]|nr:YeeE/YedE family protein [Phaeodactylibacter sp.]